MADLMRWGSMNDLQHFRDEMSRFFADTFSRFPVIWNDEMYGWSPAVNVYQNDDEFTVEVEMPGVRQEDINISITRDSLKISGQMVKDEQVEEKNYLRRERRSGYFSRSFTLPADIDPDKAEASYKDGVLKVTLPKSEQVKPRTIEIKPQ